MGINLGVSPLRIERGFGIQGWCLICKSGGKGKERWGRREEGWRRWEGEEKER